jgi:hypothetical protein
LEYTVENWSFGRCDGGRQIEKVCCSIEAEREREQFWFNLAFIEAERKFSSN